MLYIKGNIEREAGSELEAARLESEGFVAVEECNKEVKGVIPLTSKSLKELKELAKTQGIEGASNLKKEELIEILEGGESTDETGTDAKDSKKN